ncbi:MAG: XrtA/PEP-CTERM system TPR-repeat protein PrsT [Steroidobacteraceae bacterium]
MNALMRAGLVGILAIATVAGCDRLMSTEQRLARAQTAFDAGNDQVAMADVKGILDREPGNVAGRVLLARLSLRIGDPESARKELDRAIAAGADRDAVRDLDRAILLAQGKYADLLQSAQADTSGPPGTRWLAIANAQMGLGHGDEARQSLDRALEAAPDDPDVHLADARWYWAAGRIGEAVEHLDRLIAARPDDARAALYRGRLAMSIGDAKGALAALTSAREHMAGPLTLPEQLAVRVGLVEAHIAAADLAGADKDLADLARLAPEAFPTRFLRARIAYARHDYEAATTELRRALTSDEDNVPARLLLGAVLIEQGSLEQAGALFTRLVAEHPDNIEARKLLARVYLERKDPVGARRVLAEAPAGAVRDAGADWLSGSILMAGGQTDEGLALLEQGAAAAPGNTDIQLDLANAYLMAGRRDDALRVLHALAPEAGGLRRRQLLVLAQVSGKDAASARQAVLQLTRDSPDDAALKVVGAYYLLAADAPDAARGLFRDVIAAEPRNVGALLGLAALEVQAGDTGAAEEGFRRVIAIEPANERAYIGLATVALAKGDRAAAAKSLEQAISANPSAVDSRLRLADLAFAGRDTVKANALLEQALAVTRSRAATLDRVGQVLMRASQFDAALRRFNESAGLGNAQANVNAAMALLALGQLDDARTRLEVAVRERPAWPAPNMLLAQIDMRQKHFDRALERVAAFEKAGAPAGAADELRGDVLLAAGRAAEAVTAYARAADVRPSAALAIRAYRAAAVAGRTSPEAPLRDWLRTHPKDAMVLVTLAEYHQRNGERAAAIREYEQATAVWKGPAALNNLAWLYYEAKDPRALGLALHAHEAAPENPDIADTYGWILVESGNIKEGLPILEVAARAAPGSAEIQFHHAAALARAGQKEAAATVLRKLIAENADFPSRSAAEALLRTLP